MRSTDTPHGSPRTFVAALTVALALVVAKGAQADDALQVTSSLSEQHVNVGDSVTLEVNVTSHVDGSIEVTIPQVPGLTEVSRSKSEGTSISWSSRGQQVTREYTISVELQADKPGKVTIPPVQAKAGGKRAASAALPLEVGGTEAANDAAGKAEPGRVDPPGPGEQNLFLRYKVDRSTVYVGQQILLDLDVYASPSLNFGIEENAPPPPLDGFWREIVEQPQRLTRRIESVGGRSWQVYRLWRLAIFPLEAGERVITPTQLSFAVNRSIFGGGQRERRRSPAIKLDVKPLPNEGRPANFVAGNVGSYKLSATVDRTSVPAGKAVVLTLSLTGRGNVKNVHLPELSQVPGFRVFAPTVSDDVKIDGNGLAGEKKAEILLMPESGGRLEIPALELAVFDPETERYERLTTPSIRVAVEGDPAAVAASATSNLRDLKQPKGVEAAHEETTVPSKAELRPLRYRSTLAPHATPPWESPLFAALFLGPPLAFVLMLLGERAVARAKRETPESRRRAAARHARQRLGKAEEAAKAKDAPRAYLELTEALLDFASEKTGVAFRGMTAEEMRRALETRGAAPALAESFASEMERASYARFVPGSGSADAVQTSLDRAESILEQLEAWTPMAHDEPKKEARR